MARVRFIHPPRVGAPERFAWQEAVSPIGRPLHLLAGFLWCVFLGTPNSYMELALAPALLIMLVRLPRAGMTLWSLIAQPTMWALLALFAWSALSHLWTGDRAAWLEEFGAWRFLLVFPLLWPVLDGRRTLIAGVCIGLVLLQCSQVMHAIGSRHGIELMTWPRAPERNSGWADPVVAGSLLCAAMGFHVAGLLLGQGRIRLLAGAGMVVTLIGILATGTRGAWIASAGVILVGLMLVLMRTLRHGGSARVPAIALGLALVGAGVGWMVAGDSIAKRFDAGVEEVTSALDERSFDSDTGARLLMWWWGVEAGLQHPVRGVGAGGYRAWVTRHLESQEIDPSTRRLHAHAHGAIVHEFATLGLVGVGLSAVIFWFVARRAWTDVMSVVPPGYDAGPALALVGLLFAGLFDSIQVNAQTAAMLSTLVLFCLPQRPGPSPRGNGYGGIG